MREEEAAGEAPQEVQEASRSREAAAAVGEAPIPAAGEEGTTCRLKRQKRSC